MYEVEQGVKGLAVVDAAEKVLAMWPLFDNDTAEEREEIRTHAAKMIHTYQGGDHLAYV